MSAPVVVVVHGRGVRPRPGVVDEGLAARMLGFGLMKLLVTSTPGEAVRALFTPTERVGIKINAIAGRELTTPPEAALPLARLLVGGGLEARRIVIWDRTNRELKAAGYRLNQEGTEFQVFGTDSADTGYSREPLAHRSVASRFSSILTDRIDASVSFAVLKDHGLAGFSGGMKNYFGAIHNPNKYHETNCDPGVADVFDAPSVKSKHRLTILDALTAQYHRGPSFHPKWADGLERFVFGLDPVAVDAVGHRMIEELRKSHGLPSLVEDGRPPAYLNSAEKLGLGVGRRESIRLIEDEI
jgi:uncharacterized protein (DUF362 family)